MCTLAALFLIDGREELFIEASKQADVTEAIRGVIGKHHFAKRHHVSAPVASKFSLECQDLLTSICPVPGTGLSGVYNIVDHYEHEQKRGVEYVSTMHKAMNGVENFPYYSPTHLLKRLSRDKLDRWHQNNNLT